MALAEVSIVPVGTGSTSLSTYVAACLEALDKSGLSYELHGMGTIIEGDLRDLFHVISKMHEAPFQSGAFRVLTTIKIDDRKDKVSSAKGKVKSVMEKKHSV